MSNPKEFNCIMKLPNGAFVTYRKVSNLSKFRLFAESKNYVFYTVYDKKTRQKLFVQVNNK